MKTYIDALKRINEKEEEYVSEEKITELAEELLSKNELICGSNYGFQDGVYFTVGRLFTEPSYNKSKAFKGKDVKKLYIFVESIQEKIKINVYKRIDCEIVFIGKKANNSFSICIDKRINCLMKDIDLYSHKDDDDSSKPDIKESSGLQAEGRLYVAKVYDLIEMYNCVGDKLFDKNVRCKISKDVTGVGEAILNTLKTEPEQFWLLNNGITMIAENVDMYKRNSITISCSDDDYFSVINGAQTISTCADFFFSDGYSEKEQNEAKENAYVVLRLVSIKGQDKRKIKLMESKISVALNRQKPIDAEDLAYSTNFVSNINSIAVDDAYKELKFKIAKKGEEFLSEKCYALGQLGKLIYAGKLQKPGSAKNAYIGTLLKTKGEDLRSVEVFKPIKMDDTDTYLKEYGAVNLINCIHDLWLKNKDDFIQSYEVESIKSFLEGSNYYFVALMMWALFGQRDFGGSSSTLEITTERILKYMNELSAVDEHLVLKNFADVILETSKKKKTHLEYNDLKKDDFYNLIDECVANDFKNVIVNFFEKDEEAVSDISANMSKTLLDFGKKLDDEYQSLIAGKQDNEGPERK